jgi:hypothetical protein
MRWCKIVDSPNTWIEIKLLLTPLDIWVCLIFLHLSFRLRLYWNRLNYWFAIISQLTIFSRLRAATSWRARRVKPFYFILIIRIFKLVCCDLIILWLLTNIWLGRQAIIYCLEAITVSSLSKRGSLFRCWLLSKHQ